MPFDYGRNYWRISPYAPFTEPLPVPDHEPSAAGNTTCITFHNDYLPYVLGALAVYTYDDAWQGSEAARKLACQRWEKFLLMLSGATGECDMAFDVRQNDDEPCILEKMDDTGAFVPFANLQLCPPLIREGADGGLEVSPDGGDTWIPSNPRPPAPPQTILEATAGRCLAATNAVEVISMMYGEAQRLFGQGVSPLAIVVQLLSLIPFIIFYPPAAVLLAQFWTGLDGILLGLASEPFAPEAKEQLKCILYCNSKSVGGTVFFAWQAIIDEVLDLWNEPDLNEWAIIYYLLRILDSDGLQRAGATPIYTEGDCEMCADCGWTHIFTFNDGELEGWAVDIGDPAPGVSQSTTLHDGRIYVALQQNGTAQVSISREIDIGVDTVINNVLFYWGRGEIGNYSVSYSAGIYNASCSFGCGSPFGIESQNFSNMTLPVSFAISQNYDASAVTYIEQVIIQGSGSNPFLDFGDT